MGQRNVFCTHQMFDLKSEQSHSYIHPNHYSRLGNIGDYPNQNIYPVQSTVGNTTGLELHQFAGHHGRNVLYGNQHNNIQYYHHLSNFGLGGAAASNFYSPYMLPSSSSRHFVAPLNNGSAGHLPFSVDLKATGIITDEYGIIDSLIRSRKRKDVEVVPGNFYLVNGPANSNLSSANLSLSSEPLQWEEPYKYVAAFAQPEYQGIGICPTTEGSYRSVRSGSSSISLQPEPTIPYHHNYLLQGSNMGQSSQPSSNSWVEQLGNHFGNRGHSNWNYTDAMTYMHGRFINPAAVETANIGMQEYQDTSSNRNSAFITHYPPSPNLYEHLPPVQSMPISSYSHHSQTPTPSYWHPLNNFHTRNIYPSRDHVDSDSSFPSPFPSISEQINTPSLQEADPEITHRSFRILSEDAAALQISRFYGFEGITDQHRDMRLDIDDMSYEELLALEEQIGVVNTGLSEESILKNLKTSCSRAPRPTSSQLDQPSQVVPENEPCTICQVEYEDNEWIGTLDCSHSYHADCIKQWLLVKNLCPICKKPALAAHRRG